MRTFLIFITLLAISFAGDAQHKSYIAPYVGESSKFEYLIPYGTTHNNYVHQFKGPVKSVRESVYETLVQADTVAKGELTPDGNGHEHRMTWQDTEGRVTGYEDFSTDGFTEMEYAFTYNQTGQLTEIRVVNDPDYLWQKVFTYDSTGSLIDILKTQGSDLVGDTFTFHEWAIYNNNGDPLQLYRKHSQLTDTAFYEFEYNAQYKLSKEIHYLFLSDNKIANYIYFSYDSAGRIAKREVVNTDTTEHNDVSTYKYNDDGTLFQVMNDINSSEYEVFNYKYDADGNLQGRQELTFNKNNGSLLWDETHMFEYDPYGNWVRKVVYVNGAPDTYVERVVTYYK